MEERESQTVENKQFVIQNEINAAPPGGTVSVPPGTYKEQLVINKPLTLTGPDPAVGVAIVDAAGMAAVPTIQILTNDVTVTLLTLENGPLHGIQAGHAAFPNLTNIVITDNIIRGHGNAGVLTNDGAAMHIKNNVIEDNGQGAGFDRVGIVLFPHGASQVIGNIIRNNTVDGIFARNSSSGLLIEDNKIEQHTNSGITLGFLQRNTTIRNNRITDSGNGAHEETGGIILMQAMAKEISGNMIRNSNLRAIMWTYTFGPVPNELLIVNNTIESSAQDSVILFSDHSEPLFPGTVLLRQYPSGQQARGWVRRQSHINFNNTENNTEGALNVTAGTVDAVDDDQPVVHDVTSAPDTDFGVSLGDAVSRPAGRPATPVDRSANSERLPVRLPGSRTCRASQHRHKPKKCSK